LKKALNIAGHIARTKKETFISIDDLKEALQYIEIIDKEVKRLVYSFLKINPELEVYSSLESVKKYDRNINMLLDDTFKDLIFYLTLNGISLLSDSVAQFYDEDEDEDDFSWLFDNEIDHEEIIPTIDEVSIEIQGMELIKSAKKIKKTLSSKLLGQEKAIDIISDSIKNNILANTNAPKNTYIFLGPPATGKTYLAELLSEELSGYKLKRFDMTQYTHKDSGGYLYGTARFWGNAKPGSLTTFVRENPKSVIVLDEFEKANNSVQANLLTVFEGGFLDDVCGWCPNGKAWGTEEGKKTLKCKENEIIDRVDFTQTIFIITSNLGKELYSDSKFLHTIKDNYMQAESMILDVLRRELKDGESNSSAPAIIPELVSRFSQAHIILFDKLNYTTFEKIADKAFRKYKEKFCEQFHVEFIDSNNYTIFLKLQLLQLAPEFDARRINSKIGINFFDKLTDLLADFSEDEVPSFSYIKIKISKSVREFLSSKIDPMIVENQLVNELFRKNMTIELEEHLTLKNDVLTYTVKNCLFKKITKIKDFSSDGLVFDIPDISFNDIAGHDLAKKRLKETIGFLKKPQLLKKFNITSPKGMLLYGPPGTGKTLLAKAFAHEANLPFIATTGTNLLDIGTMNSIFTKAKEYAPSIIFIDEIDAIGSRELTVSSAIINQFISELDGFSSNDKEGVFVIAATNYKERIDSAILRPGRIELHININSLDKKARKYFLEKIISSKLVEESLDLETLVMYTAGLNGSQLELIGKESAIYCIRNGLEKITQEILIEQINIVKYGQKIYHKDLKEMLEETAIHESGHAILSKALMPNIQIEQITITPRENTLGFVSFNNEENIANLNVEDIKNKLIVLFGGRAAQIKKYGDTQGMDSGAANDLQLAMGYAYTAIAYYGMDKELGYINISKIQESHSNIYETKIEDAVERWLKEAKKDANQYVDKHWSKIEKLAELLLDKEVVFEKELLEFFIERME